MTQANIFILTKTSQDKAKDVFRTSLPRRLFTGLFYIFFSILLVFQLFWVLNRCINYFIFLIANSSSPLVLQFKVYLQPMRLTYLYVYFYENNITLLVRNALNNLKKIILQFFVRLFAYYFQNVLIKLLRSKKDCWKICYFWCQIIEN